jgi:hypothetical protein
MASNTLLLGASISAMASSEGRIGRDATAPGSWQQRCRVVLVRSIPAGDFVKALRGDSRFGPR